MGRWSSIQDPQAYIIRTLKKQMKPGFRLVLFGSRVRGEEVSGSDWDFGVIGEDAMPKAMRRDLGSVIDEMPWNIDLIDFAAVSKAFRDIAMRDAIEV